MKNNCRSYAEEQRKITEDIRNYERHLWGRERHPNTVKKYMHDIRYFLNFVRDIRANKTDGSKRPEMKRRKRADRKRRRSEREDWERPSGDGRLCEPEREAYREEEPEREPGGSESGISLHGGRHRGHIHQDEKGEPAGRAGEPVAHTGETGRRRRQSGRGLCFSVFRLLFQSVLLGRFFLYFGYLYISRVCCKPSNELSKVKRK